MYSIDSIVLRNYRHFCSLNWKSFTKIGTIGIPIFVTYFKCSGCISVVNDVSTSTYMYMSYGLLSLANLI